MAGYRAESKFGHEAESRHRLDTRSVRSIPPGLNRFEPGWSLERTTSIKKTCTTQFGMLDLATPGTLRIVADAIVNALWSARPLAAPTVE